jgi:hypothetical protein
MAQVEDMYPVTYSQGENITVHMDDRDLVFRRKDGMYVADFTDWLVDDKERESLYSRKQVRWALEAGEYLRALGYPSMQDAINLVRDGNVRNVPYGVEDVRRFFDIHGAQIPALRGKTTRRHAKGAVMEDLQAKMQLTEQTMVADVMHVVGDKFIVSVSSPLEVLLTKHLANLSLVSLGAGVQSHINTLRPSVFWWTHTRV